MPAHHATNRHDRLRFGGRIVSRDMADDDPHGWVRLLETVRAAKLPMECLCRVDMKPLPMFVARHGNTMVIKRAPGSGLDHHPMCPSHGHSAGDGRTQVAHPAIETLAHGGLRVSLDVPLTRLISAEAKSKSPRPSDAATSTPRSSRSRMSLLGLLEVLWERSGLHKWQSGQATRRLGAVYRKLQEELGDMQIGPIPADEIVYVPDTHLDDDAMARKVRDVHARLDALSARCKQGEAPVLLVVGEVRSLFDAKYNSGLRVKGLPDAMTLWMSAEVAGEILRRFDAPVRRFMDGGVHGTRLLTIASVTRTRNGSLHASACDMLETTADFIPVDSLHEVRLANALVHDDRSFTKPLRHDQSQAVHPDFVLHDAKLGEIAMEVWGMDSPQYRQRKNEKIAHYSGRGLRLWQWNPLSDKVIPTLPAKKSQ